MKRMKYPKIYNDFLKMPKYLEGVFIIYTSLPFKNQLKHPPELMLRDKSLALWSLRYDSKKRLGKSC